MTGEPTTLPLNQNQAADSVPAAGLHYSLFIVDLTLNLSLSPRLSLLAVYEEGLFTDWVDAWLEFSRKTWLQFFFIF